MEYMIGYVIGTGLISVMLFLYARYFYDRKIEGMPLWPLGVLCLLFGLFYVLSIPTVMTEQAQECSILPTNVTNIYYEDPGVPEASNFTTHYTYNLTCFSTGTVSSQLVGRINVYFIYLFAAALIFMVYWWALKKKMGDEVLDMYRRYFRR